MKKRVRCRTCGKVFATHRAQMDHHKVKHQSPQKDKQQEDTLAEAAISEMWDEDYDVLYWHGLEDTGDN